jgi:hypothetical protein
MLFFLFLAFSFIVASKAINFGFSTDKGDIFIVGELENPENSEISIEEIYD